jgi:hypothetical protein
VGSLFETAAGSTSSSFKFFMVQFTNLHPLVLLITLFGCSNSHGTASVSGTVLYKNQPIDGATVIFHPQGDSKDAKPAQGRSGSGGHFTLTTYLGPSEQPAGALPGEYKVTVTKIDEPQGTYDPHKDAPLKNHVPGKYSTPQQSPLAVTVKPGTNRPELKLED